tara:strand:- start:4011 stop:4262 length:252 start_codon:yes stop_codon:yes gene_type:complete
MEKITNKEILNLLKGVENNRYVECYLFKQFYKGFDEYKNHYFHTDNITIFWLTPEGEDKLIELERLERELTINKILENELSNR